MYKCMLCRFVSRKSILMLVDESVSFKVLREFKIHNFLKDFRESIDESYRSVVIRVSAVPSFMYLYYFACL